MSDDFVNLHTHADTSAFDGMGRTEVFARRAADLKQPALALTDHGTVRGLWGAAKACRDAGIKFLPGIEAYLCDDATQRGLSDDQKSAIREGNPDKASQKTALKAAEARQRDRDHITIWAETEEGLRNLYRLSSWAWHEGFYIKPRIDLARLAIFNEGLLVSTGCPTGVISSPLRAGKTQEAMARLDDLAAIFGDRLYVEIMPHLLDGTITVAPQLTRLARQHGLRMIATQDAHYPKKSDSRAQDALLCINTRDKMSNPGRFRFSAPDYWLRTRAEMAEAFRINLPSIKSSLVERALDETCEFAERVTAKIEPAKPGTYLASPDLPDHLESYDDWLVELCGQGIVSRLHCEPGRAPRRYLKRLAEELELISELQFSPYFLIVHDICQFGDRAGIWRGAGRGSGAGSLVNYLLGITEVDPLVHGTMFARFISRGRSDLPDIDIDYASDRRDEVFSYLIDRYGQDHVARISTTNRLGGRAVLHDLARVFSIPDTVVAPIANLIVEAIDEETRESEDPIADIIRNTAAGRDFAAKYPQIAKVASALDGQMRSVGVHAGGVVVSSEPLRDIVPLETRAQGKTRITVTAFDKDEVEQAGLVKIDVLSVTALTTLRLGFED